MMLRTSGMVVERCRVVRISVAEQVLRGAPREGDEHEVIECQKAEWS
jgi:hypothetical protein